MTAKRVSDDVVSIPSIPILRDRLSRILTEARRLRLLIRTASELEKIESGRQNATGSEVSE